MANRGAWRTTAKNKRNSRAANYKDKKRATTRRQRLDARQNYNDPTFINNTANVLTMRSTGVDKRKFVRLKYADTINAQDVGGIGTYRFRLNGLFDPAVSLGGHQPYGYDQWSNFYGKWRVHACKYEVQFLSDTPHNGLATCRPVVSGSGNLTTPSDLIEQPNIAYSLYGRESKQNCTLQGFIKMEKFFGEKITGEDNYEGSTGVDPANQCHLDITMVDLNAFALTTWILVELTYYIEFFQPKEFVSS